MRLFVPLLVAASSSYAVNAQTVSAPPAPPVPAKAVQLSKVVLNPDIPKTSQRVKVGTICLLSGGPLSFGSDERTVSFERFERLFDAALKKAGLNVVAKSSDLFEGETNTVKADFLVGATFKPTAVDICDSVNGVKGKITVEVEWQLFDRSKQQVVAKTTTQGTGTVVKFNQEGLDLLLNDAFTAAANDLVSKGLLQKELAGA